MTRLLSRLLLAILASAAPLGSTATAAEPTPAPSPTAAANETGAERLHRKGVHCMEVIERSECAIEHFEALLDEDTRQRELVTDALLRLMTLYRREGRTDEIGPLLRRFWDAGGGRRSKGHVPYSARFMPSELDMLINLDPPRVTSSAMLERSDDLGEYLFTCDEVRRKDIEMEHRWRRAATLAAAQGRETWEVFYEELDQEWERDAKREARQQGRSEQEQQRDMAPLVFEVACPLVEALQLGDNRGYRRMTGASHHRERNKVVAIFQIDDLDTKLAAAAAAGRLVPDGPGHWRLPEFEYGKQTIRLASLDKDELVAAPAAMLSTMEQASGKRRRQMNRELARLVDEVPKDTAMFVVLNQAALRELGFGGMERRSVRSVLEALLPRPKGLQVAAIIGPAIGMFTRVPTESAVRGRMLVSLANTMLARSTEDDPEAAKWLDGLDVAEASDRKALLASYVITLARLEEILWD
ncbi:MAG: hypothetical protein AB1Z98_16705 [Nannocystaceae bacterium]